MSKNMGTIDRVVRVVVAAAAAIGAVLVGAGSIIGVVLLIVAAIMLLTAAVGFCPLYKLLKLDTRSRRAAPRS